MYYSDVNRVLEGTANRSYKIKTTRHVHMIGDSVADVERWMEATPARWGIKQSVNSARSRSWDLDVGMGGAKALAKTGWSEGARDLGAALSLTVPATGRGAGRGHGMAGHSVSIGRFVTGNPRCMNTRRKHESGSAKVLHIVINTVASAAVGAMQFNNYGAAIVAIIDRLEARGRRVHLDAIFAAQEGQARYACGWTVKQASEQCDLGQIAFAIAHPAAFRRLGFAMIERGPKSDENSGYGTCLDIIPDDVPNAPPGAMLVDGINHEPSRCNSPHDALRLAVEQINKAAVLAGHATVDDPLIELADDE